jgi:DTW domain-containing protein YfiP
MTCFCSHVQRFDSKIDFVILIHPIEMRRRIATGRMSHLCLANSYILRGHDYTHHETVNELLADGERHCVLLYPGAQSLNLTTLDSLERKQRFSGLGKRLTIFVVDGTWETAKKMVKHSRNLHHLPRICFTPERPSNFRIRKQPRPGCVSTIEAIHQTIELLGPSQGYDTDSRVHDRLLYVFDKMVETQLSYIEEARRRTGPSRYHSARSPRA